MATEIDTEEENKNVLEPVYRLASWVRGDQQPERMRYAPQETGWGYSMGDGTYRLANTPIMGMCGEMGHPDLPQWGDLVRINGGSDEEKYLEIIEKYDREAHLVTDHPAYYKELQEQAAAEKPDEEMLEHMDDVWEHLSEEERSSFTHHRPAGE